MSSDQPQQPGGSTGPALGPHAALVERACRAAALLEDAHSDEEFTDAQHTASEDEQGEEGMSGAAAPHAMAADGEEDDVSDSSSPADCAAAGAVEAAAAAAVAGEGREWDQQMVALAAIAQAHVQAGKLDRAVNEYSDMLRRSDMAGAGASSCATVSARRRHAALLLARSAAYAAFSQQLRSIPAAQSESRALFAPDPCHLASLALKDAEAAAGLDGDSPEPMLHKGYSLFLLERYTEAGSAYRAGLQLQPTHEQLQAQLRELQAALAGGAIDGMAADGNGTSAAAAGAGAAPQGSTRRVETTEDTECVLCMKLFYEPVSTPCGHTFCKPCFSRAMDHSNKCPHCRTVLHAGRQLAVTITLKSLLERCFPDEYEARRQEESEAAAALPATDAPLPMFVMSMLLPGEKMALNIFEPRYRLMVRRCMEGNRAFGMATVNRQHELSEIACEAEITECQPLPDGRYYIEVLGRRRFRPAETWEQDGYRVARPEYLSDDAPPADSEEAALLAQEAGEVEALADAWLERLRSLAQTRRGVAELLVRAGNKPMPARPEALSFWVANLICPVLDVEAAMKQRFVTTRSTLERLQTERQVLQQLNSTSSQGCSIM